MNYVPFDSDTIGNPAIELGDVLIFSGGQADEEQITCVTSYTYKIGGKMSLKCVGKNPRLSQAKSKNDKNISGLLSQVDKATISVHTYTNAAEFELGETKTECIKIEFAASQETSAQFFAQILVNVTADPVTREATATGTITIPDTSGGEDTDDTTENDTTEDTGTTIDVSLPVTWTEDGEALVYVTYVLNEVEMTTFYPVETWHSGKHILTLYYPIAEIASDVINYFKVYLWMTGGTGVIELGGCLASISGQALGVSYTWDGELELEDEYVPFTIGGGFGVRAFSDAVSYVMIGQTEYEYTDTMQKPSIGAFGMPVETED